MSRAESAFDRLSVGLLVATTTITAALYTRLPDTMPIHFGLDGRADGFAPKYIGAWLLPLLTAALWPFVRFGGRLLRSPARERYERSPIALAALLTAAFMAGIQLCVLAASLRDGSFGRGFALLLAAFWFAMALIFPKVRRNPFLGVRVRWTLASDENWARTHRFAGQCCFVGALVALLGAVVGSVALAIVAIVVTALAPVLYSYRAARADRST
jgi:uncharacterized membrane protein